jgi:hypothetical protein
MENKNFNQIENYLQNLKIQNTNPHSQKKFPNFANELNHIAFWKIFKEQYKILFNKNFIATAESKSLVYTLYYYFLKKENFFNSTLLYPIDNSNISLDKGLIIIGGFGVGKTSILKTFEVIIENLSLNHYEVPVRMHNTSDIVVEYEGIEFEHRNYVIIKYSKGFRIFDDIKNEREASNFGKVDILKEILYMRCENRNFRTILLCNYDSDTPKDMNQAIDSLERYGERVYDRLFEAFNFIQLKDLSKR